MRPPQPSPPSGEAGHDEEHREVQQKISEVLPGHAAHRGTHGLAQLLTGGLRDLLREKGLVATSQRRQEEQSLGQP